MTAPEALQCFLNRTGKDSFVQSVNDGLEDYLVEPLLTDEKGIPADSRPAFVVALATVERLAHAPEVAGHADQ